MLCKCVISVDNFWYICGEVTFSAMTWWVPANHTNNCYFCMIPPVQLGMSSKKKWTLEYLNIPSVIHPVPSVSQTLEVYQLEVDEGEDSTKDDTNEPSKSQDPDFFHII